MLRVSACRLQLQHKQNLTKWLILNPEMFFLLNKSNAILFYMWMVMFILSPSWMTLQPNAAQIIVWWRLGSRWALHDQGPSDSEESLHSGRPPPCPCRVSIMRDTTRNVEYPESVYIPKTSFRYTSALPIICIVISVHILRISGLSKFNISGGESWNRP